MNARLALLENERLTNELLEQVNNIAERRNLSQVDAIDYLLDIKLKSDLYTDAQKLSIELRLENIRTQITA